MKTFLQITIIVLCSIVINDSNCSLIDSNEIVNTFADAFQNVQVGGSTDDKQCVSQMINLFESYQKKKFWAMQVIDSWGKIPSGILSGNLYSFGNFDQCLQISHNANLESDTSDTSSSSSTVAFIGQYCLATIMIDGNATFLGNYTKNNWPIGLLHASKKFIDQSSTDSKWSPMLGVGICFPQTCTIKNFTDTINTVLEESLDFDFLKVSITEKLCQQKIDSDYDPMDIFTICLFTFILILMTLSTAYDLRTRDLKSRNLKLILFSIYTNGQKLFNFKKSDSSEVFDCLNGIRALTVIWVVYCAAYGNIQDTMMNVDGLFTWLHNPFSMIIAASTVAADTLFLLSGLLVAFNLLKHLEYSNGKPNIPLFYLHRYLRITPVFAAAILFYSTIFRHFSNGPLWKANDPQPVCSKYWWASLLYIQNYYKPNDMCLGNQWYLMVDMQLYLLSPLLIYPLWRWRNKFAYSFPLLILANMIGVFTIFITNSFVVGIPGSGKDEDNDEKSYFPTHARYGAWCVGVLLGYILHQTKSKQVYLKNIFIILGWFTSIFTIIFIIFAYYPMNQYEYYLTLPYFVHALYEAISRVFWTASVGWIIFACIHGYGGPVNWLLSLPHWQPISRLSYCIFVLYGIVMKIQTGSIRSATYFNDYNAIHQFWGNFGIIICVSILWTMAFEMPILALEKLVLNKSKKSREDSEPKTEEIL